MAHPGLNQSLVNQASMLNRVLDTSIFTHVELLSAFSCSHHVDDSLVAFISELYSRPACLIENSLPDILVHIGLPIHDAPINQQDGVRLLHLGNVDEYLLQVHLKFHKKFLELDGLGESHRPCICVDTSFLKDHGGFWY